MPPHFYLSHVHILIDVLRTAVKITENALAAGCQLFYRKFYGYFAVHLHKPCMRSEQMNHTLGGRKQNLRMTNKWTGSVDKGLLGEFMAFHFTSLFGRV